MRHTGLFMQECGNVERKNSELRVPSLNGSEWRVNCRKNGFTATSQQGMKNKSCLNVFINSWGPSVLEQLLFIFLFLASLISLRHFKSHC